jgi:hypothetical protein
MGFVPFMLDANSHYCSIKGVPMILILLPTSDYDPTESSVPWQAMRLAGLDARFATPTPGWWISALVH